MDIEKIKQDIVKYGLEHNPLMYAWSDEDLGKVMNGCGPAYDTSDLSLIHRFVSKILFGMIPNHGIEVDYTPACCIHDFDYEVGTSDADKDAADKRLESNMKRLIRKQAPTIADEIDSVMPWIYYEAVHLFGRSAFEHKDPV